MATAIPETRIQDRGPPTNHECYDQIYRTLYQTPGHMAATIGATASNGRVSRTIIPVLPQPSVI
jgi:hypothetical protein